jgi:hypothetical protein
MTSSGLFAVSFYDKDKQYISHTLGNMDFHQDDTFTMPYNAFYVRMNVLKAKRQSNEISLVFSTEEFSYNQIVGEQYHITFPTSAGTVYGGTVKVEKDGTGMLTVDRKYDKLSNHTFTKHGSNTGNIYYTNGLQSVIKKPADGYTELVGLLSSQYKPDSWEDIFVSGQNDCSIAVSLTGLLAVKEDAITSLSDFTANRGNVEFVYPLATPIEYDLTPGQVTALLGINNLWADTGDIEELAYPADTRMYIERRLAEIVNALS